MMNLTKAMEDICLERQRQVASEGWTEEHDAHHNSAGQLSAAAMCYCMAATTAERIPSTTPEQYKATPIASFWPWKASWWKPKDPRRDLVRAGALIIAEIERLDRAATRIESQKP
jgi:hypothetical protein